MEPQAPVFKTTPTGRVLIPVKELQRLQDDYAAKELLEKYRLMHVDDNAPIVYDPEPHVPRKQPDAKYFFARPSTSRTIYKRTSHKTWARR